jgi:excisionase family DNA binding protein
MRLNESLRNESSDWRSILTAFAHRQFPPSATDAAVARLSGQILLPFARRNQPLTICVTDAGQEQDIELPASAVTMLMEILVSMAAGRSVTIVPENAELTTVEAAEVLNVSRPFLIKLLDGKKIPFRKVGKHRRIRMEDVMAFKAAIDSERQSVLDQLATEAQKQGMGYP